MSGIQRYELNGEDAWVSESKSGEYVLYSDHIARHAEAVRLLMGVKESLEVIRDMKLPMLSGVVGGAFIGTEKDIDAFLAGEGA